jgi:predicted porin
VFILGANVDYNFYPNFAFRVTPTYVGTMFNGINLTNGIPNGTSNGSIQNNLGVNAGIVYRFGRIK